MPDEMDELFSLFGDEEPEQGDEEAESTGQEEESVQEESTGEADPAEVAEEEEAPAEEAPATEGEQVGETPAGFIGGKYKSAEDLEKAYLHLQSSKDSEIAQVRAKVEAYESIINGPDQAQGAYEAPQQAPVEVSSEDLEQAVKAAPIDTFQWTMQNRPDLIPEVISIVRDANDHRTADAMSAAYTNAVVHAQQLQFQDQMYQAQAPQMIQSNIASAVMNVKNKYGEDFELLQEEVAGMLKQNHQTLESYEPQYVEQLVEHYLLKAYRQNAMNAATGGTQKPTSLKKDPVQSGKPVPAAAPVGEAEEFVEEIVAAQKKMNSWM